LKKIPFHFFILGQLCGTIEQTEIGRNNEIATCIAIQKYFYGIFLSEHYAREVIIIASKISEVEGESA
jgi:hypothetical protein